MELEKAPTPLHEEDSKITLTIRLIMQGKEVGSIIGKKGEIVKRFREESGAKINISDGSCPERIVTVTGNTSAIFKAFTLICKKFEEWCSQFNEGGGGATRAPITLRLIVPASQCGSLIGKGGSKIKEIRDVTGANIQVASEMLPNSTERAVTISGTCDAITQCIYHICCVMLESPPKGATIPYRPKPNVAGPVILAGGQAYTIQGNYAVPAQDIGGLAKSPLAGLAALGLGGLGPANTSGLNPAALAALAGSQLRTANQGRNQPATNQQSHEMTVPNELIGCIIGKGGTKIAEIRQISGAMIRISNCEEREGGSTDRTITITGNPDSVALAQYLINMSVELQKANLEGSTSGGSTASTNNPLASAIPLAQLLTKTGALGALNSLTALGGLTDLLSGSSSQPVQTTGVHRNHKTFTQRRQDDDSPSKSSKERNKYNPY
ncbi:PREDICTED: poly(rC)-binding protein 3 isoform X1 [Papilio xuthus]|uniref:Poly(RC)-binding protein 3 isoform X1 n=1 Tax=Papilio xuthus TaxID=66420 RepID=A0AAJ6Z3R8_PAPXU|nr:PREDICTED: poly(rC)-binding protein 3 isoform X1 [Papilio xuthus]XP_013164843.1 PREDICTED: poly(rC)-binding protein 3 isoform X1 [Papilio xuthus]XP_013164844.1 PREDICTED: poly(rC)-binding protein 3 isoform X1 [Papilio xuthus]XP_013164845.1 PREDICTED: poly(rC)-binding protein 3 isoform X1 [Papilio xuthus]